MDYHEIHDEKENIMANNEDLFKKIISHAKEYGFIFP